MGQIEAGGRIEFVLVSKLALEELYRKACLMQTFFVNRDCMNAQVHEDEVHLSPITARANELTGTLLDLKREESHECEEGE